MVTRVPIKLNVGMAVMMILTGAALVVPLVHLYNQLSARDGKAAEKVQRQLLIRGLRTRPERGSLSGSELAVDRSHIILLIAREP
jgi:hypothetical protein